MQSYNQYIPGEVTWTAQAHSHSHKSQGWIISASLILLVVAAVIFLLSSLLSGGRDYLSAVVVLVFGGLLILAATRQPQEQQYSVSDSSITVGDKTVPMDHFRSFSVKSSGDLHEIDLVPAARFAMPVSLHCTDQQIEQIVAILEPHLQLQEPRHGIVEEVMHRVSF